MNTEHTGSGVDLIVYADHLAMLVTGESKTIEFRANNALKIINDWMKENRLELAPHRCGITLGHHKLKIVKQERYLGVILDSRLSNSLHIDHVTNKATKTIGCLRRIMPRCRGASENRGGCLPP